MFGSLFKRDKTEQSIVVGRLTQLVHDITTFQYGTIVLDGVRYCARTADSSELCKGQAVEVLSENNNHGTAILTVKKVS